MQIFGKIVKRTCFVLLAVLMGLSMLIALAAAFFSIADEAADASARVLPSYAREDISGVLAKETWTEEDYAFLYRQTGLGKSALDGMKGDTERILGFQDALFYDGELEHEQVAFTTRRDVFADGYYAPLVDLEDGDVLVTSTCHTFGWRNGHAAIVIDGDSGTLLESVSLGTPSTVTYNGTGWFRRGTNFMVLRLKDAAAEERAEIAATAKERLNNIPYSITVGLFSPKDQGETPAETHCSHLVWQAYKYFGYDIDADGGPVCTCRDIANSDLFEVVQVFGFDPVELW